MPKAEAKPSVPSTPAVKKPLETKTSISSFEDPVKLQKKIKELEEKNRQLERNQSKFLPLQETLEQEKRARADSEQRITKLEHEKRKLEMKNSDDVRKNEDFVKNLKNKIFNQESEISHLKSKVGRKINPGKNKYFQILVFYQSSEVTLSKMPSYLNHLSKLNIKRHIRNILQRRRSIKRVFFC